MDDSSHAAEAVKSFPIRTWRNGDWHTRDDVAAVEEPLEIQVAAGDGDVFVNHPIAVTMRTPGHDRELALGFLYTESVITGFDQVQSVRYRTEDGEEDCNVIQIRLVEGAGFDADALSRHVFTSSSCGICGKITIDQVRAKGLSNVTPMQIDPDILLSLPQRLRDAQEIFEATGGLHAAALFNASGEPLVLREDVGRHNALDKVIGTLLETNQIPSSEAILMLSGRASFELIQKAVFAGIPVVAAVGAPSSLAIDMAHSFGIHLAGFLRDGRFNLYTSP